MIRAAARIVLGALVAFVLIAPAVAAPKFPPLTGRVVDDAGLLSPQAEARLTAELAQLEETTGHQVVVATLPDLQGYEIEDYGYQLLRAWGIGRKDEDDGVILIVAPNQRKVRIEVGYGLEPVMTDAVSRLIIERQILPAFREGDFERGVVAGTEAIVRQIGLPEGEARDAAALAARETGDSSDRAGVVPIVFAIFVILWLLSGVMRLFGARRRFGGSGLWWLLPLLLSSSSHRRGGGSGWSSGGGGGGFSGGGGSGGGGGASGSW